MAARPLLEINAFLFVLLLFYTSVYVAVTWFIDYFYPQHPVSKRLEQQD